MSLSDGLTNYTWKLQFTHEDKQPPFFGRDYAANKKAFLFSLTYVLQDDWLHFISKIPELLIIMNHWTFITKKTHYTGSFRICTALWGTFIILFISKSFLSSRRCGKWVTFISLQTQIFQPKNTVHASECLELFHSRGHCSYSVTVKYMEAFASALFSILSGKEHLMKSAHSEDDANSKRSCLGCSSAWRAINVQLQHEICTKAQMCKCDTKHQQSAPITVFQSHSFILLDTVDFPVSFLPSNAWMVPFNISI